MIVRRLGLLPFGDGRILPRRRNFDAVSTGAHTVDRFEHRIVDFVEFHFGLRIHQQYVGITQYPFVGLRS